MPAVPAPAFAILKPALDLISMHGELEAVPVDSANIDPAYADSPFPSPRGLVPVSVPDPVDPMHITFMSTDL
jgi:hypothetical protein